MQMYAVHTEHTNEAEQCFMNLFPERRFSSGPQMRIVMAAASLYASRARHAGAGVLE